MSNEYTSADFDKFFPRASVPPETEDPAELARQAEEEHAWDLHKPDFLLSRSGPPTSSTAATSGSTTGPGSMTGPDTATGPSTTGGSSTMWKPARGLPRQRRPGKSERVSQARE